MVKIVCPQCHCVCFLALFLGSFFNSFFPFRHFGISKNSGSKSHIKEAKERTGDLIESNFLVEKNADQRSEGGRITRIPTEKDLQYPGLI